MKKDQSKYAVIVAAAIAIGIVFVAYGLAFGIFTTSIPVIDGIICENEMFSYHIHAHLDIFVNEYPSPVPAAIGIVVQNHCFYWLHTHKSDGIIHIEPPTVKQFTLGQFFDVWRSSNTLSPPSQEEPIIYVNGQLASTKLKDTPLRSHDEIVLVYGSPPFLQYPNSINSLKVYDKF